MSNIIFNYDVIVIGAGHAGVEAALATARLGKKTALITLYKNKIASMPCNPSIGGPAKGIVVREIDALGGEMGKAADATALQTKLLNLSKGPGVWAIRTQTDKLKYSTYMQKIIQNENNLVIIEDIVSNLIIEDNQINGVILQNSKKIFSKVVILTTGTYLKSIIFRGKERKNAGPNEEITTSGISETLNKHNIKLQRFKTGTPPRVKKDSIDLSFAKIENGTEGEISFSFSTSKFTPLKKQESCYLIHSTRETKKIIEKNLNKAAMYSGTIFSTGPRYCPSFEDKIIRFQNKDEHQIFLEPESKKMNTFYVQGFSTSMPIEIQEKMLRSLPGFKNVVIDKWAYAIEYDCIDPIQLKHSLEIKSINNLFCAGQINGTSGYEEAAGQGIIAGINASRKIDKLDPIILKRDESYIGVMIDDLINKGANEPYRLLTSRAEHRLLLRNDNAEERLKEIGYSVGLIKEKEWNKYKKYTMQIEVAKNALQKIRFTPKSELALHLKNTNQFEITQGISGLELIKQPQINIKDLIPYIIELQNLTNNQYQSLMIGIRFDGYIKKQYELASKMNKLNKKEIPNNINYDLVSNLAIEARQKLNKIRPNSIGQASRISGVNPADIQMLLFYLKKEYANDTKI
ncbi:tRNA uridine-5-carboxymethylaminomethyl(34) synthesis enzyme MnmG [Spiroplasma endosymbiont of Labia minor]|uniref:tRNA uridine-5-carboxymethylaminomethyl(34) synthesis enzyme MnmG n=1 Tax=Spiroplasma endosymbiont of Labia minor TaxID=3066305 RepID=UPI0030CDC5FE